MAQVVTLTVSPTIDTSTSVDHVVPERKLRCEQPRNEPGGGGINVSRVLRRFGVDSKAVFTAGGMTGELLTKLLAEEGLSIRPIPIGGATRENVTVREDATTLQYRFCMPGPVIQHEEWHALVREVEALDPFPAYLVISGSLPPGLPDGAYAAVAGLARAHGSRVILDTSGRALRATMEAGVFLVKPNIAELAALVEVDWIEDEEQLLEAANRLVTDYKCEAAVVSLGAAGALVATRESSLRIPAPAIRPQSKVGAGDSMVAGIVWGLVRGSSVVEAASLGVASGAAAVMTPGTELCRREDVERLHAQGLDEIVRLAVESGAA